MVVLLFVDTLFLVQTACRAVDYQAQEQDQLFPGGSIIRHLSQFGARWAAGLLIGL